MSAGIYISTSAAVSAPHCRRELAGARALLLMQAVIWVVMFAIFFASPVLQLSDSQYSMLTAESLIYHGTPDLSSYTIENFKTDLPFNTITGRHAYQLERINGKLLYGFPHGTSLLSTPFVILAKALGISPSTSQGKYDLGGEATIQKFLAAILMASLVVTFFRTSLILLDSRWATIIAIGAGVGTQIWSTASRGMWSHTWEVLLGGLVVDLLLHAAVEGRLRSVTLATVLSWMFFVRPTGAGRRCVSPPL